MDFLARRQKQLLEEAGMKFLPLYHWEGENDYARQAVNDVTARNGRSPTWGELNYAIAALIGDDDIANQMAHNAVSCGAVARTRDPAPFRYKLGDYTPFDWDAVVRAADQAEGPLPADGS